jgi:predicted AlkP superfamily pyrophosphatase or phosphodiesterase
MPKNAGYALVGRAGVRDHDTEAETAPAAIAAEDRAADNTGLVARAEAHAARRYRVWRVVLPVGVLVAVLVMLSASGGRSNSPSDQIVILVSCDGFRSDYRYRAGPAMRRLMAEGVQAEFMRPAFPSKTFPNHYSLVTGLWPESHGIVGNSFVEPSTGEVFSMQSKEPLFWRGEPLWVTAEKAGVRSAPGMWPGADVNMSSAGAPGGGLPSYALAYTRSIDKIGRISWLLEQLARPREAQPRFLTLYMEDLDDAGHQHGPDSPDVAAAILDVDTGLQALLDGLKTLREETQRRLNIVVVGDHGMVGTSSDRVMVLPELREDPELLVAATAAQFGVSPVLGLRPVPGRERAVLQKLNAAIDRATGREYGLRSTYNGMLDRFRCHCTKCCLAKQYICCRVDGIR